MSVFRTVVYHFLVPFEHLWIQYYCWDAALMPVTTSLPRASILGEIVSQCVLTTVKMYRQSIANLTTPKVNHALNGKKKTPFSKTRASSVFLVGPSLILHWCGIISFITSRYFKENLRRSERCEPMIQGESFV